jgi:hypothetical protein
VIILFLALFEQFLSWSCPRCSNPPPGGDLFPGHLHYPLRYRRIFLSLMIRHPVIGNLFPVHRTRGRGFLGFDLWLDQAWEGVWINLSKSSRKKCSEFNISKMLTQSENYLNQYILPLYFFKMTRESAFFFFLSSSGFFFPSFLL